ANQCQEKDRAPVVLHFVEGKTIEQIARELGWPTGSVSGRLDRAKHRLRSSLGRQGVTSSVAALATILANNAASAEASASLVAGTVRAAALSAAGKAAEAVPARVAVLVDGLLHAMRMARLKIGAVLLALVL